ncbi:tyrosine protein phosphatase yvh1 [Ophidiomyces ophidiicola]|nr:tyrosine protein phosphatase yvh1 [Ophidiomyces ophidiicola]KAI2127534.1 tyrosine protein phosphatase yvh1 [Ophidiomyces ophidiicola]KAI2149735.1 tyrosine protein phosphatase yvh1 [Ophidiomyces ophidiicola]KAI2200882.1 tyrosine protein phosphatase yvh1 [Ophidiomyces ophidiicola]KAI2353420.1 tyrosine protein phosphatase yvh1 [Ophidiomyces ophidiicola]
MRGGADSARFRAFQHHLHIAVDDMDDEDLLQHFPATNAFVQSGLASGGGVLIHCAMGKSRSATVCIAFLLHRDPAAIDPAEALMLLRRTRPMCEPNDGFMEQLRLYHKMACPENVADHPLYQRWLYQKAVEDSVACGRGPDLDEIRFEDKATTNDNNANARSDKGVEVKCRKCRSDDTIDQPLANADALGANWPRCPSSSAMICLRKQVFRLLPQLPRRRSRARISFSTR